MRFDEKSNKFYFNVLEIFNQEFLSRIKNVYELTIRMHPIVQDCDGRQLCIKGMRINTELNLKGNQWEPFREGMNEIHLILNESNCYTIYTNKCSMIIEHRYFKSWENDKRTILFFNALDDETVAIECNFDLVYPLLYALDKLEAMY